MLRKGGAVDNIAEVDPNATLLRVRQVMMRDDADFLLGLSHAELADMVLCACANLSVLRGSNGKGC